MHDDVTSQERSKERLYEEEIELKWEKGGSGLVFYTDAQYWQEEEGGMVFSSIFGGSCYGYFIAMIHISRENIYLMNDGITSSGFFY